MIKTAAMIGSYLGGIGTVNKPVKCAAGVQGPPVYGGKQVAVIDFVGHWWQIMAK